MTLTVTNHQYRCHFATTQAVFAASSIGYEKPYYRLLVCGRPADRDAGRNEQDQIEDIP